MQRKVVFPQDVDRLVTDARTMSGGEKAKAYFGIIIGANIGISFISVPFFTQLGVPTWVPLLAQTILSLMLFIFIYRMFVFKENEKMQEISDGLTDSFSKYCYLRNMDTGEVIKASNRDIKLFELDNGATVFYLRFLYGEVSDKKSIGTRDLYEQLFRIFGEYRVDVNSVVSEEVFEDSNEHAMLLHQVSSIDDPKLSRIMQETTRRILEDTNDLACVDCVTLRIKTRVGYQRYIIDEMMNRVFSEIDKSTNSFRSVQVLMKEELLDYFKSFYRLSAIDLASMKIRVSKGEDDSFRKYVQILSIIDEHGVTRTRKSLESNEIRIAKRINL